MIKIITIVIVLVLFSKVNAQSSITADGNYVFEMNRSKSNSIIIKSTSTSWKYENKGVSNPVFTQDSKNIIFKKSDSLCVIQLGTSIQNYTTNVKAFYLPKSGSGEWLTFEPNNEQQELVLRNLLSGKILHFKNVAYHSFDPNGNTLLVKMMYRQQNSKITELKWIRLANETSKRIWSTSDSFLDIKTYSFDETGTKLAFIVQEKKENKTSNSIWYYEQDNSVAKLIVNDEAIISENTLVVDNNLLKLTTNGTKVLFNLKEKELFKTDSGVNKVEVWSFRDPLLQSKQKLYTKQRNFAAIVSVTNHQVIRLQYPNECLLGLGSRKDDPQITDDYALICQFKGDIFYDDMAREEYVMNEYNWNIATQSDVFLMSTNDGSRKLLSQSINASSSKYPKFEFSPEGQYVLYYDQKSRNYFTYEITTNMTRNLTCGISISWSLEQNEASLRQYFDVYGFETRMANWNTNDQSFVIYDHYFDIWLFDPKGNKAPIPLTQGYCRKNNLRFEIKNPQTMFKDQRMILHAIKEENYEEGIFIKDFDKLGTSEKLAIGPFRYGTYIYVTNDRSKDIHFFSRQSFKDAPRMYYSTNGFKSLHHLGFSNLDDDTVVNSEVIKWKAFDGKTRKGILFKPDGFDPNKRYPIIFCYYDKLAGNMMNEYLTKKNINFHDLDAEYCLSNGYLVFILDIHYTIGETGRSAYNSVVSAAKYLSSLSFVDGKRLGITGLSFGGYQTNYLATHSKIFAAAASTAGYSNLLACYGIDNQDNLSSNRFSLLASIETGQGRIGTTPWERPDLFIKNSAFFYADKVVTPLLLIANKDDGVIPPSQSIELFTALRRLGKKAWLILGENGGHGGHKDPYKMQFFDYYLKDKPPPRWMVEPVPYRDQGNPKWTELDSVGKTPGAGLLMKNGGALTPQQKELLKHKTRFNERGWIEAVNGGKKKVKPKRNKK